MEVFMGVLFIALLFTAAVSFGFRGERQWGALAAFFIILFLPIWALAIWVPVVGPILYGIAWLDILFFALVFTFLIMAISPDRDKRSRNKDTEISNYQVSGDTSTATKYGVAFWAFLVFIIFAIFLGSARPI